MRRIARARSRSAEEASQLAALEDGGAFVAGEQTRARARGSRQETRRRRVRALPHRARRQDATRSPWRRGRLRRRVYGGGAVRQEDADGGSSSADALDVTRPSPSALGQRPRERPSRASRRRRRRGARRRTGRRRRGRRDARSGLDGSLASRPNAAPSWRFDSNSTTMVSTLGVARATATVPGDAPRRRSTPPRPPRRAPPAAVNDERERVAATRCARVRAKNVRTFVRSTRRTTRRALDPRRWRNATRCAFERDCSS